jgi:hypothetical protein
MARLGSKYEQTRFDPIVIMTWVIGLAAAAFLATAL